MQKKIICLALLCTASGAMANQTEQFSVPIVSGHTNLETIHPITDIKDEHTQPEPEPPAPQSNPVNQFRGTAAHEHVGRDADSYAPEQPVKYPHIVNTSHGVGVLMDKGVDDALLQAFLYTTGTSLLTVNEVDPRLIQAINAAAVSMTVDNGALVVNFDQSRLEKITKNFKQNLFHGIKSPVMAFMVINQHTGNEIINHEKEIPFLVKLNEHAKTLNYDLFYPLLDLTDVQNFTPDTILSHDDATLAKAAARYESEYFVSATLKYEPNGFINIIWNLYDKTGQKLYGSTLSGLDEEVATDLSVQIAKVVNVRSLAKDNPNAAQPAQVGSDLDENAFALGPRNDAVRIAISNVNSLNDVAKVRSALITYGYDNGFDIVAMKDGNLILDIHTNASPSILDGTMSYAQDFSKAGQWHYVWSAKAE